MRYHHCFAFEARSGSVVETSTESYHLRALG